MHSSIDNFLLKDEHLLEECLVTQNLHPQPHPLIPHLLNDFLDLL